MAKDPIESLLGRVHRAAVKHGDVADPRRGRVPAERLENWGANVAHRLERLLNHPINSEVTVTKEPKEGVLAQRTAARDLFVVTLVLSGHIYERRRIGMDAVEDVAVDQALHSMYGMVDILEIAHSAMQEGYPRR